MKKYAYFHLMTRLKHIFTYSSVFDEFFYTIFKLHENFFGSFYFSAFFYPKVSKKKKNLKIVSSGLDRVFEF